MDQKSCWHWLTLLNLKYRPSKYWGWGPIIKLGETTEGTNGNKWGKGCDWNAAGINGQSGRERLWLLRIWGAKNWWIIGREFHSVPTMSLSTGRLGCETETWSLWQEVLASGNWRERGHVTSTHHQLYQILLVQLAGSRVISHFPKLPREISSSVGPSSQRTGDRVEGWSGLLGADKE